MQNTPSLSTLARQRLATTRQLHRLLPLGRDQKSTNMRRVLIDGVGVGFASAASPFLPVLLTRLGAENFAVGLLTSLPALAGLLFALPIGHFLQRQRQIVPWFSAARLMVIASYAAMGLIPLVFTDLRIEAILTVWAFVTIPNTVVNVAFTVVMANVAGPEGRFYLMSRRWSILGLTNALTIAVVGQLLDIKAMPFPMNYSVVFGLLSLGGLVSFYFSSHIVLPDQAPLEDEKTGSNGGWRRWRDLLRSQPAFVRFTASQFLFRMGMALALPLFPLYYVRTLHASDASIGVISTMGTIVLVGAYFLWSRITRRLGVHFALLATTLGLALYPLLVAFTNTVEWMIVLAAFAGIFGAGLDLVFFDVLVDSLPPESSPTFVGMYQTTNNVAIFIGPLIGTALSAYIGIPGALIAGGIVRLLGFATFAFVNRPTGAQS
jgi:MFS family permease